MFLNYISFLQEKGMSQNTIISYMNDIKSFLKEMNLESNDYVTAADIRKWVNEMLNSNRCETFGRLYNQSSS